MFNKERKSSPNGGKEVVGGNVAELTTPQSARGDKAILAQMIVTAVLWL
jgi:hypothetical protein